MLLRPFLNDATSCASYLFGCSTHAKLAIVDPHADLDSKVEVLRNAVRCDLVGGERKPRQALTRG